MSDSASNVVSPGPSGPQTPIHLPSLVVAGAVVLGRYQLVRELGRGGFGVVWQAHDSELSLDVALKFLPDLVARDPESIEELKREIRRGLRLTHPGIVRVHNFQRDDQLAAIAMELIDGDTLRGRKRSAPDSCLDVADVQPWVSQICDVLTYVHENVRLVHRDLKPGNLMLTRNGEVKVADFGIASSLADSLTRMTNTPASGGTLAYMSPQQARGEPPLVTDDIYALGATFYELLTSKPPFFRGNIALQAAEIIPPPMAARRVEFGILNRAPIPEAWERAVAACLSKHAAARPQSVRELRAMLEAGPNTAPASAGGFGRLPAVGSLPPPLPEPDRTMPGTVITSTERMTATTGYGPATAGSLPPPLTSSSYSPAPSAPLQQQQLPPPIQYATPPKRIPVWPFVIVGTVVLVGFCAWAGWMLAESGPGTTPAKPVIKPVASTAVVVEPPATNDVEKLYAEGLAFENGTDRALNAAQAATYYQRASDQGHIASTARLARLYNYGFGVRRDEKRARTLAELAAEKGDPVAANLLAVLLRGQRMDGPELMRAVGYLERAAQGGSALAMLNLADHLRSGRGVAKDESRAEDLDRRALAQWKAEAAAGNLEAHYWLGLAYSTGRGTTRDLQAAFREYEVGANGGHPRALQALAECYARGWGVEKNEQLAIANFQKSVDAGWLDAFVVFAQYLSNGTLPRDNARALSLYDQAIANGSTTALFRLGEMLYEGDPALRDDNRAVALFQKAADAGESDGWWRLGLCYETGRGVAKNESEAFRCYQKAAEQDDFAGLYYVGRAFRYGKGTSHDPARGRTYLERSANAGLWLAMVDLGVMLRLGEGGPKDLPRSAKLFAQAANAGFGPGQFHYGYACEFGLGVDQNQSQAAFWYEKAVAQGLSGAQTNLGIMLLEGRGVEKDIDRAITLFRAASASGEAAGQTQLGQCYFTGTGVKQDYDEAYQWFGKGAAQGFPLAQLNLGWCLHNGYGCERDYAAARGMYEKAAAQGNARAMNNLGVLYLNGLGIKSNRTKATEYFRRAAQAGDDLGAQNLKQFGAK